MRHATVAVPFLVFLPLTTTVAHTVPVYFWNYSCNGICMLCHSIFARSLARSSFSGPHGMSLTHAACDQPLMNSPITKLKFCHSGAKSDGAKNLKIRIDWYRWLSFSIFRDLFVWDPSLRSGWQVRVLFSCMGNLVKPVKSNPSLKAKIKRIYGNRLRVSCIWKYTTDVYSHFHVIIRNIPQLFTLSLWIDVKNEPFWMFV